MLLGQNPPNCLNCQLPKVEGYIKSTEDQTCYHQLKFKQKGDGNDGEPDALEKLEMEKKAKNWLELKNCGWLGSYLKNIQSDLPNETRGQS